MPPTTRGHDGTTGSFTSLGIFGATGPCKLQPRVETHCEPVHPSTWIVPDNHGQPILPEESGPFFSASNRQRPATKIRSSNPRPSRTAFPVPDPRTRMGETLAVDHWLVSKWKSRSLSHYYAGVTSHHSMATRNLELC